MTKNAYISINMAEYHQLFGKATFAEMAMYIALKKLANFKTGQVGGFRKQKLNYERLGEIISRPKRGTAPAEVIDRNKARYLVEKLQSMGLVSDIRFDNDALKLKLPLSPIGDFEEVPAPEPTPALEESVKRQRTKSEKSTPTLVDLCDPDFDPFAISTDGCQYNQNHHPVSTPGHLPIDTDTGEGTSPSGAEGAIHPQRRSKSLEGKPAELSFEAIEQILQSNGFRLLKHEINLPNSDGSAALADLVAFCVHIFEPRFCGLFAKSRMGLAILKKAVRKTIIIQLHAKKPPVGYVPSSFPPAEPSVRIASQHNRQAIQICQPH